MHRCGLYGMAYGLVDFVTTGCKLSWIEDVWGKPVPQLLVGMCEPAFMAADKHLRERKAYGYGILTKSIGKKNRRYMKPMARTNGDCVDREASCMHKEGIIMIMHKNQIQLRNQDRTPRNLVVKNLVHFHLSNTYLKQCEHKRECCRRQPICPRHPWLCKDAIG